MVIVSSRKFSDDDNDNCGGLVVVANTRTSPSATLIVAPTSFVDEREEGERRRPHLKVTFFDGQSSRAQVVAVNMTFALLTTKFHSGCEEVVWMESNSSFLTPPTFLWLPVSSDRMAYVRSFTIVESLESYNRDHCRVQQKDSEHFFLISCKFDGESKRLLGAPVFAMGSSSPNTCAMGVVVEDIARGSEMRLALSSTYIRGIVKYLIEMRRKKTFLAEEEEVAGDPPAPPSPPRRKRRRVVRGNQIQGGRRVV